MRRVVAEMRKYYDAAVTRSLSDLEDEVRSLNLPLPEGKYGKRELVEILKKHYWEQENPGQPVGDESKEGRRGIGSSSAMRSSGQGLSEPQILYRRLDGWDEDNDDGNSFTEDDERAAYSLARDVNLGITRGRDLMAVMKDNDKVIGAVWTEMDGNEFSFDLAVAPSFQGRGYGNKLTDLALQAADSERSYNDDFRINVQVTSPREKAMLEKRGLVVEQQLPDGSWMMTDRPRIEDPDED